MKFIHVLFIFADSILSCAMIENDCSNIKIDFDEFTGYSSDDILSFPDTNMVLSLTFQGNDYVWAATLGGAICWNIKDKSYKKIILDADWEPDSWKKFLEHNFDPADPKAAYMKGMNNAVQRVYIADNDEIWIKTRVGLAICKDFKVIRRYKEDVLAIENEYNKLIEQKNKIDIWPIDNNQNIWLLYQSLNKVRKYNGQCWETLDFNKIAAADNNNNTDIKVFDIYLDLDRKLWFATNLGIFKHNGYEWEIFSPKKLLKTSTDNILQPFFQLKGNSNIWFGTTDGLTKNIGKNWILYKDTCKAGQGCTSILERKNGELWVPSVVGIWVYKDDNWQLYSKETGLPTNYIRYVFEDSEENLWLCTDKGVVRYDDNKFKIVYKPINQQNERVDFGCQGPNGHFWFTTISGFICFDGAQWKLFKTEE